MTPEEALKLKQRAIQSARKRGFADRAEDLSQDLIVHFLESEKKGQTIDQALIDIDRGEIGRSDSENYETRKALRSALSFYDETGRMVLDVKTPEYSPSDLERIFKFADGEMRIILKLYFVWGLNGKEIADLFDVSESRINQRMSNVLSHLSAKILSEEPGQIEAKGERSLLEEEIRSRLCENQASDLKEESREDRSSASHTDAEKVVSLSFAAASF